MPAPIVVSRVSKSYVAGATRFDALADVTLEVADQEFVCIVGPSGCGKSTLLRMLGGLDAPTSGSLHIADRDASRPLTCLVFQEESVFPWLTVEDNASYGLRVTGRWNAAEHRPRLDYFLEKTGLAAFRRYYPHQLSGGMKQRLSVARAFVTNPQILLMDEPFGALDEQNKRLLQEELGKLWEESRITVVFITHSIDEAVLLGDRVAVMTSAPGRLKRVIDVPFRRPRDLSALRTMPGFTALTEEIWSLLREEVLRARGLRHARAGAGEASARA